MDFISIKVDDASGRYSTGWFWGNHYWTGSQSLCENLAPKNAPTHRDVQTTSKVSLSKITQKKIAQFFFRKINPPKMAANFQVRVKLKAIDQENLFTRRCRRLPCRSSSLRFVLTPLSPQR